MELKADDDSTFQISKSGKNSKSARAWAHVENIFVTAPETDDKMVKDGKGLLHEAKTKQDHIEKLRSDEAALTQSGSDPTRLAEIQTEIPTLQQQIEELNARGDEIVEVRIAVPLPRDEKTKELLRELAKLNPEDPRAELWSKV